MKFKINDQYEIDSKDITKLTFKLIKIVNGNSSGVAFFSSLSGIPSYLNRAYPELMNDSVKRLVEANSKIYGVIDNKEILGKHKISFYIDDFYSVELDNENYVMYVHPTLNGAPGSAGASNPVPNKDRKKVVCYPSSIKSALELYYNQMLRDCQSADDAFMVEMNELINKMSIKVKDIIGLINTSKA
jgi:hypothetical protein